MTISTVKQFHTCTMSKGKLAKLKLEEGLSEVTDAEELKKEIADLLEHNGRVYGIYRRKELAGAYFIWSSEEKCWDQSLQLGAGRDQSLAYLTYLAYLAYLAYPAYSAYPAYNKKPRSNATLQTAEVNYIKVNED